MRDPFRPVLAVVLDVAGTVVDFGSRAPLLALRELFAGSGQTPSDAALRASMGKPKREHIRDLFGKAAPVEELYAGFEAALREKVSARNDWVHSEVPTLLSELRGAGVRIGFCSGYDRAMLRPFETLLSRTFGARHGIPVVAADDVARGRPHPDMALRVAELLGADPVRCLKVGDTRVDMREGVAAGMRSVGVLDSGNEIGLDAADWAALPRAEKELLRMRASRSLIEAGAAATIRTVGELKWLL
jgi:phosphonoacetaldehyde hydrolase